MRLVWFSVIACCFCLVLFVAAGVLRARDVRAIERVAVETNFALCALKADIQRRYDNGVDFLERNPQGIPGLSATEIGRSLESQRSTLEALESLECK